MEKGFGFVASSIALASVALIVVACSDDKEPSTFEGGQFDASTDGAPVFGGSSSGGSSGGSSGEGGTGGKCEPTIADNYSPKWDAPAAPATPGPCTDATVGTYYDECLATLGKSDHQTRCDAWKSANAACGQCVEPANNTGPIQWFQNRFYYTLNVAGCIGIQQGNKFADTECGFAFGASVNCNRDACAGCFGSGATFPDFTNCQNAAKMVGICKTLNASAGTGCPGDLQTADATKGCFKSVAPAEETKTHFTRVMGYFCAKQ